MQWDWWMCQRWEEWKIITKIMLYSLSFFKWPYVKYLIGMNIFAYEIIHLFRVKFLILVLHLHLIMFSFSYMQTGCLSLLSRSATFDHCWTVNVSSESHLLYINLWEKHSTGRINWKTDARYRWDVHTTWVNAGAYLQLCVGFVRDLESVTDTD